MVVEALGHKWADEEILERGKYRLGDDKLSLSGVWGNGHGLVPVQSESSFTCTDTHKREERRRSCSSLMTLMYGDRSF